MIGFREIKLVNKGDCACRTYLAKGAEGVYLSRSRVVVRRNVFSRNTKLIASEAAKGRIFQTLAAWVLVLALALVATFAAIWLAKWLDENQITSDGGDCHCVLLSQSGQ
jgi:hypothetical protein